MNRHLSKRLLRIAVIAAPALIIAFGIYLSSLYRQLGKAFETQSQFVPTRIYADVVRIAPPQSKAPILERLQVLGYSFQAAGEELSFRLHPVDYPTYLVPDQDPTFQIADQTVTLHFDSDQADALLQSISVGEREVPDFYLEPELVATLSRNGVAAGPAAKQIRSLVKFNDVPALVWKAIIAVEDPRFLEHKGLDPRGFARAIWVNIKSRALKQGGSTLTQQLVKNLMARRSKSLPRKASELFLALLLEANYDKEQILERYLNEVALGQVGNLEVHGVAEGAEHFFGRKLDDLNLAEIALMAGLIRGPDYYSPYKHRERILERQKFVLKKMVENGQIAEGEAEAALKMPVRLAPPQRVMNKAPYFTDFVKAELVSFLKKTSSELDATEGSFRVYSTLDMNLNSQAQLAVANGIADLEKRTKLPEGVHLEGALASVDHTNGYIRALIGGSSYFKSTFNRILNMKRQVGSTFKPLVYLTAFNVGKDPQGVPYGPGHPAEDAPWKLIFDKNRQNWAPKNYEPEFMGWINFRVALAHSINTVAAKLGSEIGVGPIIQTAQALGITSNLPAVPSLALGVAELSPIELLKAYSVIASHGVKADLAVIRAITHDDGSPFIRDEHNTSQVYDPAACDLLTETLQSVFTEGTARAARAMGFDRTAAGKTGTTSNHRDSWFAGYTPQLTTVVWVGLDQDAEKSTKLNLTGAGAALPIWVAYMNKALSGEAPANFSRSPSLVDIAIDRYSGKAASSGCPTGQVLVEKYIRGKEPTGSSCESGPLPTVSQSNGP